jgi:asparagine synthase (glutamine-hydrolysing)
VPDRGRRELPGLIGVVERRPDRRAAPAFEVLLRPMRRSERWRSEVLVDAAGRWAIGRVHLGILQPTDQLSGDGDLKVLFHGELVNEDELRPVADGVAGSRVSGVASLVGALYRRLGCAFAAKLKGAFCAAILDLAERRLVLVNDLVGSYPLYWAGGPERFSFASELRSLLHDPSLGRGLDPRAVADFLAFGFVLGEKTLAKGIAMVPAGSTVIYDWSAGSVMVEHYRQIADAFRPWDGPKARYLDAVCGAFEQAVSRALRGPGHVGLSLSGGLDSRAILSAVGSESGRVATYTLGVSGCADEVIAARLAKMAGTTHRFLELDDRYLGRFLPNLARMVSLTDGMYLSHGLTEMLALGLIEGEPLSMLLRGHGGELAKASLAWPFHTDDRVHGLRSKEALVSYLLDRTRPVAGSVALGNLLTAEWWSGCDGGPRRSLADRLRNVDLAPADLCSYVYLTEQHRRFTVPSLELFRNVVEVRLPFVDQDFLGVLFRGRSPWRDGTEIHRALVARTNRKLLKVRNSNTGAPADAGPLLTGVLGVVDGVLRRLQVRGYRHYHSFERWMEATLVQACEMVLLERRTLARGVFREKAVRELLDETKRGAGNHGYLLQAMLILELWQRENLDGQRGVWSGSEARPRPGGEQLAVADRVSRVQGERAAVCLGPDRQSP